MDFDPRVLSGAERLTFALRALYRRHGYRQYRMSKFEEYDLYSKNKDFLVSDSVLTFTDVGGKLMALKPDVTLSLIKSCRDLPGAVQKLYYNENVYRVAKGSPSFREIMQVGLECIGDVDDFCIGEVLLLAAQSLNAISGEFMLDVSHLGILTACVAAVSPRADVQQALFACAAEKNQHGILSLCRENGIDEAASAPLRELIALYGAPEAVLPRVRELCAAVGAAAEADALTRAVRIFSGTPLSAHVEIDFSVVSDTNYYNGVVFKGFVDTVPQSVLSGGQYDKLMTKMHRRSRAIGFAVYVGALERLYAKSEGYDADLLLLYEKGADPARLRAAVQAQIDMGKSVLTATRADCGAVCRETARFRDGEVVFDG